MVNPNTNQPLQIVAEEAETSLYSWSWKNVQSRRVALYDRVSGSRSCGWLGFARNGNIQLFTDLCKDLLSGTEEFHCQIFGPSQSVFVRARLVSFCDSSYLVNDWPTTELILKANDGFQVLPLDKPTRKAFHGTNAQLIQPGKEPQRVVLQDGSAKAISFLTSEKLNPEDSIGVHVTLGLVTFRFKAKVIYQNPTRSSRFAYRTAAYIDFDTASMKAIWEQMIHD